MSKDDTPQLLAGGQEPAGGECASGPGGPPSPGGSTAQFKSVEGMEETGGYDSMATLGGEIKAKEIQPFIEYNDAVEKNNHSSSDELFGAEAAQGQTTVIRHKKAGGGGGKVGARR